MWREDVLGDGYEQQVIELGADPDGEGAVAATLVRRTEPRGSERAVLYVHGFSDYFFQRELADFFAGRGYAFYALDLRKCGRSRRTGQTAHYVSDLALYDRELNRALTILRDETGGAQVIVAGHSTAGLVLPLWLNRLNAQPGGSRGAGVAGLVLNSPWFDLQGKAWMRSVGTWAVHLAARVAPKWSPVLAKSDAYGLSLHVSGHGLWDYDIAWKPLAGFPVALGWLSAIRRGHARLHRGLDIGVPSLVLRSGASWFSKKYGPWTDESDVVLDVRQIARWAGCLGDEVTSVPIPGARHDVFLSTDGPRAAAYGRVDSWLASSFPHGRPPAGQE